MSIGIGVIGAGVISDTYLTNLTAFPDVTVRFVADLDTERAAARATAHGIDASGGVAELLDRDDIDLVVNLTIPAAHATVSTAALRAGKHVWTEKPLAMSPEEGRALLALAEQRGLRVGCAPDTMLGAGIQTARRAIADGRIGRPTTALALFQSPGPDAWHPNPAFLFQEGAGPLFDIGPYYLSALISVFGAVDRVTAFGSRARDQRVVQAGPLAGTIFDVTVPTTVTALLEFREGGAAQLVLSFDSALVRSGVVEVTGPEGTAVLPDPNVFDGATTLHLTGGAPPISLEPLGHKASRGTGVLDLARSIHTGEPVRASGELGLHVLEVMSAIDTAIRRGETTVVASTVPANPPLAVDWDPYARTIG
ncbi:Gfo/Idh/MocA family protein [Stackebrandtia soli]|uniref:Gfo/Idh/MocA family protein n=1 Tax=Stackebrandtia soli TaxID=1892856 RepID=UPI0039ECA48E